MLFPTVEFAIFFLLVLAANWALTPWPTARKLLLIGASYLFYGWWDWHYTILLFECTVLNYVLGLVLQTSRTERRRSWVLATGVVFNLGVLAYFKYWSFFLASISEGLHLAGADSNLKIIEVMLPVGVSFYTFQGLSYLVDIYRREETAVENLLDMLLFKAFFPQLVAGPIVRAREFLPQLKRLSDGEVPTDLASTRAFALIAVGLAKKVLIAHYLSVALVAPVFESPAAYGTGDLLLAAYGYALQIYCDFSAYSDMAIGLALLLGFEFPENFRQPYRSQSLQEFWRRWHMSLSTFLRDYLYIPLGGSRGSKLKTYRNLLVTMLLGGLWHGAAWTYVIWGLLHGLGLAVERYVTERCRSYGWTWPVAPWCRVLRTVASFHFVCLAWIFFNAETLGGATAYLRAMANTGPAVRMASPLVLVLLAGGGIAQFLPEDLLPRFVLQARRLPLALQATGLASVITAVTALGPGALAPFIYFRF